MIINVTQDHINRGKPARACRCPIALATMGQLNLSPGHVCVTPHTLYIDNVAYRMPPEATGFVRRFDSEEEVSPFTFEVTNDPNQGESAEHQVSDQA